MNQQQGHMSVCVCVSSKLNPSWEFPASFYIPDSQKCVVPFP